MMGKLNIVFFVLLIIWHETSAVHECTRKCKLVEPSKTCHYHFTLENFSVLGSACQAGKPKKGKCILADGVKRAILTANRTLPGPTIQVCQNDRVVVNVENQIKDMAVTLHWHGIQQRGSPFYDGVPFVTQCPIQPGNTFRYEWIASNEGTHYWYAQTGLQKIEGLYGSIIVRQPPSKDPNSALHNDDLPEHVILLSDWWHEYSADKFPGRVPDNVVQGPDSLLINGKGQFRDPNTGALTDTPLEIFTISPGKRYRFRMINAFSSACPAQLTIQDHAMRLIATDGNPNIPVYVNSIISYSGERYDFVINTNQSKKFTYWIELRALGPCSGKKAHQVAVLRYDNSKSNSINQPTYDNSLPQGVVLHPFDVDCTLETKDAVCFTRWNYALDFIIDSTRPDVKAMLPFGLNMYKPGENSAPNPNNSYFMAPNGDFVNSWIDGISFQWPLAPLLSQLDDVNPEELCNYDSLPENSDRNHTCTHVINFPYNSIVELILVNEESDFSFPFHLHGHAFHVIAFGTLPARTGDETNVDVFTKWSRTIRQNQLFKRPSALKDTIAVPKNGYAILRFRPDNVGFWLFQCNALVHSVTGMNVVFQVGSNNDLPPVPQHFPTCGVHST